MLLMGGEIHNDFVFHPTTVKDWLYLLRQFALLPGDPYIIKAAWSLSFEVLFYLVFSICILAGKKITTITMIVWCLLIAVKYTIGSTLLPDFLFSSAIVEFLIGCIVGYEVKRGKILDIKRISILALIAVVLGLIIVFDGRPYNRVGLLEKLFLGTLSALLVWGGVTVDFREKFPLLRKKIFVLIGDASYSLYLIHTILLSFFCRFLYKAVHTHSPSILTLNTLFFLVFVVTVAAGIVAHLVIEKKLIAFFNKFMLKDKTR